MYWQYLNTPLSSVDFTELLKQNKDTVGWLIVNNTNITYPVVQTTNNDYYLTHAFNRSKNYAGWVFADYRNKFDGTDQNIIIYGHNTMDGSMFGSLKNILKKEWYTNQDNLEVTLITDKELDTYRVFSIYQIEAEDYYVQTGFKNEESYKKYIETVKSRSIYNFNEDVKANQILTLSTCSETGKERVVLHAQIINK